MKVFSSFKKFISEFRKEQVQYSNIVFSMNNAGHEYAASLYFIYVSLFKANYQMSTITSFNDSHNSQLYLLNWINKERQTICQNTPLYSLEQVHSSNIILSLLFRVDATFFQELEKSAFEFDVYLAKIEKYLCEVQGKRLNRGYRLHLIEDQHVSEIIKIIFYALLQSPAKKDFVNRIFQLDSDTQGFLMSQIQNIEHQIENVMEVKEILNKVEELEEENQKLLDNIKHITQTNTHLHSLAALAQEEHDRLYEEHRQNQNQKNQVLEKLCVTEMKDYLAIFKELQEENKSLIVDCEEREKMNEELEGKNEEMREKVIEDNMIINHLKEEIDRYKEMQGELKEEMSLQQQQNKENMLTASRKQQLASLKQKRKLSYEESFNSSSIISNLTEENENDMFHSEQVRLYNRELMVKLQEMYKQLNALNLEASELKQSTQHYQLQNSKIDSKLALFKKEFRDFTREYQNIQ